MTKESEVQESVVETENSEDAGSTPAQIRALKHWESYKQYCRKSVVEAWKCGGALCEVREEAKHGEWEKWLKSKGISQSTADRLRRLSKNYDSTQIEEFDSVDQALKALAARSKRKKAGKKFEPEMETRREVISGKPEEAIGGDGTPPLPEDIDSAQEVRELRDKLRETEDQLRAAEEKNAEQCREIDRLKRLLEERGISWQSTPVDGQQIYPHSAFSVHREDPEPGREGTTAAPESRENTDKPESDVTRTSTSG